MADNNIKSDARDEVDIVDSILHDTESMSALENVKFLFGEPQYRHIESGLLLRPNEPEPAYYTGTPILTSAEIVEHVLEANQQDVSGSSSSHIQPATNTFTFVEHMLQKCTCYGDSNALEFNICAIGWRLLSCATEKDLDDLLLASRVSE